VLWILAVNMSNPMQNEPYDIALQAMNMEVLTNAGLVIVNPEALNREIRVRVRASRQDIEYLNALDSAWRRAQYIAPNVDFRVVDVDEVLNSDGPVTVRLNVNVNLAHEGLEHFSIRPTYIDVDIDVLANGNFPVAAYMIGEVDSGLELQPIQLANTHVTITGTRTRIATIRRVQVEVDVWGIHTDEAQDNLPLTVYDYDGNDITGLVQLSVNETTAYVSVWPVETVDVVVEPVGSLAMGFAVEDIDHEPKTIEVTGALEDLRRLEYITIQVPLDGKSASFIESVDISQWLPAGVYLRGEESPIIDVTVTLEPVEQRIFNVPVDNVRSRGISVRYDVLSEMATVRIDVYGPRAFLAELTNADIGLELDLRNMAIGIHNVPLTVDLPEGIYLAQRAPSMRVEILEPATADEDEPTEVPAPDPAPNDEDNDDPTDVDDANDTNDLDDPATLPDDTATAPYDPAGEAPSPGDTPDDEETNDDE
jgi:YbbR domain-containing protein